MTATAMMPRATPKLPTIGDGAVVGDWFGVFIDPKNVVAFLDRAYINLNERSCFTSY